jgi:hypothetical protein
VIYAYWRGGAGDYAWRQAQTAAAIALLEACFIGVVNLQGIKKIIRCQFERMIKEEDSRNRPGAKFVRGSHRTGGMRYCATGVVTGVRKVAGHVGSRMCH